MPRSYQPKQVSSSEANSHSSGNATTHPEPSVKPQSGTTVQISSLSKRYQSSTRGILALDDVNIDIEAGEFVSIVGPSGCGKSTLMLIIAGLLAPTSGEVRINSANIHEPLTDVGIVFQNHLLMDFRTALDNIALQCEIRGIRRTEARQRAQIELEKVGLQGMGLLYPNQMSGGMRQRVAIARAFLHRPSMLLMDEPFGALDAITRVRMQRDLERLWLSENKKTVIFITHGIEEAVRLSDRIIIMSPSPGRVVKEVTVSVKRPRPLILEEDDELMGHVVEIYDIFGQLGIFDE